MTRYIAFRLLLALPALWLILAMVFLLAHSVPARFGLALTLLLVFLALSAPLLATADPTATLWSAAA